MPGLRIELSGPEAVQRFRDVAHALLEWEQGELSTELKQRLAAKARDLGVHPLDRDAVLAEVAALPAIQALRRLSGEEIEQLARQKVIVAIPDTNDSWMTYINQEVRATCLEKTWGFQIRRKWSVREKPVPESAVDDYEWKLIPGARGALREGLACGFEGMYYVLSVDRPSGRFVLQHDTFRGGHDGGLYWDHCTYTEIHMAGALGGITVDEVRQQIGGTTLEHRREEPPPEGWLRKHLIFLTNQFEPNHFSVT